MRGDLAARQPGVRGDHTIVADDVEDGKADDSLVIISMDFDSTMEISYFASADGTWTDMIHSSNSNLTDTADRETAHQEHSSAPNCRDDAAVNHDSENTDCGQNTAVHERAADISHLEEVRAVCDHEHGTRSSLGRHRSNGEQCSSTINGVSPDIHEVCSLFGRLLHVNGSLDLCEFFWYSGRVGTHPQHRFLRLFSLVDKHQPAWRFGDEEESDADEHRNSVDGGEGNEVGHTTVHVMCCIVNNSPDERANGRPDLED